MIIIMLHSNIQV